mmetsp:Transcript_78936/g.241566  ORF Transcript_78936/g.241566 Transcript_78936/m.241566 type:complete len:96 (-) Transcript_78936:1101-1388(-)
MLAVRVLVNVVVVHVRVDVIEVCVVVMVAAGVFVAAGAVDVTVVRAANMSGEQPTSRYLQHHICLLVAHNLAAKAAPVWQSYSAVPTGSDKQPTL